MAIGAVLTASPRLLVLDEPTSALDPAAAEEVLSTLARLVHDLGLTVVMAEHRLERVVPFADRIVLVPGDGAPLVVGPPETVMRSSSVAPPLVELGRLVGWDPLPLSVRDARRRSAPLRARLAPMAPPRPDTGQKRTEGRVEAATVRKLSGLVRTRGGPRRGGPLDHAGRGAGRSWGGTAPGSPRCSTRWPGCAARPGASCVVEGQDPQSLPRPPIWSATWGWCPRTRVSCSTERASMPSAVRPTRCPAWRRGRPPHTLERVLPGVPADRHPRDLSEGQRLALALAIVRGPGPALLLLDEPTRGLDYPSKDRLIQVLRELAADGHAIVLATHDVELAARVADRAVVLADGQIITDGPARQVVCHSPIFAPQVAKVLAPEEWLTVDEVRQALEGAGAGMTVSVPRPAAPSPRRLTPAIRIGSRSSLLAPPDHGVRRRSVRVAALDPPGFGPELGPQRRRALDLRRADPAPLGHRHGGALRRSDRRQGGGAAGDPRRLLRRLRVPSPGINGFEPEWFLLILAARVFGRGFGFVLGAVAFFARP